MASLPPNEKANGRRSLSVGPAARSPRLSSAIRLQVKFVRCRPRDRFTWLNGIDVLMRNTTWTMSRDLAEGMDFSGRQFL